MAKIKDGGALTSNNMPQVFLNKLIHILFVSSSVSKFLHPQEFMKADEKIFHWYFFLIGIQILVCGIILVLWFHRLLRAGKNISKGKLTKNESWLFKWICGENETETGMENQNQHFSDANILRELGERYLKTKINNDRVSFF